MCTKSLSFCLLVRMKFLFKIHNSAYVFRFCICLYSLALYSFGLQDCNFKQLVVLCIQSQKLSRLKYIYQFFYQHQNGSLLKTLKLNVKKINVKFQRKVSKFVLKLLKVVNSLKLLDLNKANSHTKLHSSSSFHNVSEL